MQSTSSSTEAGQRRGKPPDHIPLARRLLEAPESEDEGQSGMGSEAGTPTHLAEQGIMIPMPSTPLRNVSPLDLRILNIPLPRFSTYGWPGAQNLGQMARAFEQVTL